MRCLLGVFSPGSRTLAILNLGVLLSYGGTGITFPLRLLYAQAHGATSVQLGYGSSTRQVRQGQDSPQQGCGRGQQPRPGVSVRA